MNYLVPVLKAGFASFFADQRSGELLVGIFFVLLKWIKAGKVSSSRGKPRLLLFVSCDL